MDCDFVAKGETNEDIMQQAAEHARTAHNNQNGGAMLISGAADPDNSRSVLPPGVSCRGGTEEWANPTVANSPSLIFSLLQVEADADGRAVCDTRILPALFLRDSRNWWPH